MESEQTAEENSQDEKFDNVKAEAIGDLDASRRTYTCQDDLVHCSAVFSIFYVPASRCNATCFQVR